MPRTVPILHIHGYAQARAHYVVDDLDALAASRPGPGQATEKACG